MAKLKNIFCFVTLFFSCIHTHAQGSLLHGETVIENRLIFSDSTGYIYINNVTITGNKKTKDYIILREAQLTKGDSILKIDLYTIIEESRRNIYNTTLFNDVKINTIAFAENRINIEIVVKERWYIFPTPQFKLVDRNFNEWIKTYKADLRRVIYGAKFAHYNLSGRRDQLRMYFLSGYSRGIAVSYAAPYSNKALTQGFSVGLNFFQGREVTYQNSINNKVKNYTTRSAGSNINSFVSKSFNIALGYKIRKGIYNAHNFALSFYNQSVADSIVKFYNPNYFKSNNAQINYVDLLYTYTHTNVDRIAYPLMGKSAFITLQKRGFGFTGNVNMFSLEGGYTKFFNLGNNWYVSNATFGSIKLPFDQAYINQRGLGYGPAFLRGLDLYTIDGVAYVLNKATLKKKIVSFNVRLPFGIPFFYKKKDAIPFTLFAKTFTDIGYNYNKKKYDTYLNDRLLYTYGFGLDILTFYDFNIRVEYSFNQLNENGLFLRLQTGF